jgi:hypothetical protein
MSQPESRAQAFELRVEPPARLLACADARRHIRRRFSMATMKSMMLALAATCALAAPALAQGEGAMMTNGSVMIVMPNGHTAMRKVTDMGMLDAMVQKGKQLTAGQALVMSGGKLYIVEDYKMANGKMISEILMSAN